LLWAATAAAQAQDFPTHPIRVLVPYTAGWPSDVGTRLMSDPLARHLGQPLVIENKGGAAGLVGTEAFLVAPPDGYRYWSAPSGRLRSSRPQIGAL
jgi:tripartite-type tricarboxylate transporter receptor subunit TctC